METFARIGVFVEVAAVELAQAVGVGRKMPRHPVEDHAQAGRVGLRNEVAEIIRRAETRGRRVHAGGLITPGAVERVLVDRQQFEVGETHVLRIGNQLLGDLAVVEPLATLVASPRAQVHLVDRHRRTQRVGVAALLAARHHRRQAVHHRRRLRPHLGAEGDRVGLQPQAAVLALDLVLVEIARTDVRHEDLPHAAFAAHAHGMAAAVPVVEAADHRHTPCARCPDGEAGAGHAVDLGRVRAELFIRPVMRAFGQQPEVHLAEQGREAVGVFHHLVMAAPVDVELVDQPVFALGQGGLEHVRADDAAQAGHVLAAGLVDHVDADGTGQQRTQHPALVMGVQTEHGERIAVISRHQGGYG